MPLMAFAKKHCRLLHRLKASKPILVHSLQLANRILFSLQLSDLHSERSSAVLEAIQVVHDFPEEKGSIPFCFSILLIGLIEEHLLGGVPVEEEEDGAVQLLLLFLLEEVSQGRLGDLIIGESS